MKAPPPEWTDEGLYPRHTPDEGDLRRRMALDDVGEAAAWAALAAVLWALGIVAVVAVVSVTVDLVGRFTF